VYDSGVADMRDTRLTSEERQRLRERVSEARRSAVTNERAGMAEVAYEAAGGDGLYALFLVVQAFNRLQPEAVARTMLKSERRRSPIRKAMQNHASYEEIRQSA
jgi:hypothetical protein